MIFPGSYTRHDRSFQAGLECSDGDALVRQLLKYHCKSHDQRKRTHESPRVVSIMGRGSIEIWRVKV